MEKKSTPTGWIFMNLSIGFLNLNLPIKFNFCSNRRKTTVTLYEDTSTFFLLVFMLEALFSVKYELKPKKYLAT